MVVLALGTLFSLSATGGKLTGTYSSPLGALKLSESADGTVTAKSARGGGPCAYKKGTVVLTGSRLDDSVTGEIAACKVGGDTCSGALQGLAMLLISQEGNVLSGAVHLDAGQCKTPIKGQGITLRKSRKKATKKPRKDPPPKGDARVEIPKNKKIKKGRESAKALALEGKELQMAGQAEKAREKFLDAIAADPTWVELYNAVGVTFYVRDRHDDALVYYKKALELDPSYRDAYYNIGSIYALKNDREQALRYLRIAVLNGYVQVETLAQDKDWNNLREDPEFKKLASGEF
jgi:hypothetical protein